MRAKLIPLLEQCIETGIQRGWNWAHKHQDDPSPDAVKDRIRESIWLELHEWFDFTSEEAIPLFDESTRRCV